MSFYDGVVLNPHQAATAWHLHNKDWNRPCKPVVQHDLLNYAEGKVKAEIRAMLDEAGAGLGVKPYIPTGLTTGQLTYQLGRHIMPPSAGIHQAFALRAVRICGDKLYLDCSVRSNGNRHQTLERFVIPLAYLPVLCPPAARLRDQHAD